MRKAKYFTGGTEGNPEFTECSFHEWGTRVFDGGRSTHTVTVAIIELENGEIRTCKPTELIFLK